MFNMYRKRYYATKTRHAMDSQEELGHDRFNYKNPKVNYDKWPRRLRPKRTSSSLMGNDCIVEEEEERTIGLRDCQGSLREHQRLLALRAGTHKCSPKCQVKSKTDTTDTWSRIFSSCLHLQQRVKTSRDDNRKTEFELTDKSQGSSTSRTRVTDNGYVNNLPDLQNEACVEVAASRVRKRSDSRQLATNICLQYIRSSARYRLLDHLQDIGSRIDKQWFFIRDTKLKTVRLLTVSPLASSTSDRRLIDTSDSNREILVGLFASLQHPYIYPVLDVDFVFGPTNDDSTRPALITVVPFNNKGSLKDLIYRSRWQDTWFQKYRQRSQGLPVKQVQRLGRQILEALLFLQAKGYPPFHHLHSGNVIIQNGVARLTGLENTLFGHTSRIYPLFKNLLTNNHNGPDVIEVACFGHILFEMCAGYELYVPRPTARHMRDIKDYPEVVAVIELIFDSPNGSFPSTENIAVMDFFRNIDLREMRCSTQNSFINKLSPDANRLIDQVLNRSKSGKASRPSTSGSSSGSSKIRDTTETRSPFHKNIRSINSFRHDLDEEDNYETPINSPVTEDVDSVANGFTGVVLTSPDINVHHLYL